MHIKRIQSINVLSQYQDQILTLWNENALEMADVALEADEQANIAKQLQQIADSRYGALFVALKEQRVAGYALATIQKDLVTDSLYGLFDEIFVTNAYRRQHTAKQLIREIRAWFHTQAVSPVHVHVALDNERARKMFEHNGFSPEFILLSED